MECGSHLRRQCESRSALRLAMSVFIRRCSIERMEMEQQMQGAEIIVQTECYFTHRNNKTNCLTNHFAVFDKTSLNTMKTLLYILIVQVAIYIVLYLRHWWVLSSALYKRKVFGVLRCINLRKWILLIEF